MDIKRKSEYARKVISSTALQLIIINYEIILELLSESKIYLLEKKIDEFDSNIDKAQKFLNELVSSLDMKYEISVQLYNIYIYINKIIINSKVKHSETNIIEIEKILGHLLKGWIEIEKGSVATVSDIKDSTKIFAGLTYNNKGELEEYSRETGGYKA